MKLKISRYNLKVSGEENYLLNTYTGSTVQLTKNHFNKVSNILETIEKYGDIDCRYQGIVELLLNHGFIVPYDQDELNQVLDTFKNRRTRTSKLSLLVTPTLKCNMKCFYCYQDRTNQSNLKKHDIDAIVRFADNKLEKSGSMHVTWFGGEPLYDKEFLFECSSALIELAKSRNADYSSSIVSNGYLLDTETLQELVKNKVENIQITLDGSKIYHDRVRRHLNVDTNKREGSFNKIISNIQKVSNYLDITLRVNVSVINMNSIEMLIKELADANLSSKIKRLYFHPVFNYSTEDPSANYKPKDNTHLSIQHFAKLEAQFLSLARNKGFKISDPFIGGHSGCSALQKNSFIIESNGEVKKCNNEIGKCGTSFTSINSPEVVEKNNLETWENYQPANIPECKSCVFLPVCFSNCPHRNMNSPEEKPDKCPSFKYNWQDTIPMILKQRAIN